MLVLEKRSSMHKNEGPSEMRWGLIGKSGRPDLNRGPPAPKAGAIPGYATPRNEPRNVALPQREVNGDA